MKTEVGYQGDENNYYILKEVRKELKKQSPQKCEGTTSNGSDCRGSALPYMEKDQPVRCHAHSSEEAKKYNQKMKAEEERLFFQRLKEEKAKDLPF